MKRIALILSTLVVGMGTQVVSATQEGWLHKVPAGSTLIIHKPIRVPANTATVYLQGGAVVSPNDLDEYYPHCSLLVRTVAEIPQTIPAGAFTITRVYPYEEAHSRFDSGPIRVAGLSITVGMGGALTTYYFTTRMHLRSASFPDIMYLECSQLTDYSIGEHINRREFKNAVGALVSLKTGK